MWSELDVLKAKRNIERESDPTLRYATAKSKSDKIWIGIVFGLIGIMFIGRLIRLTMG